MGRVVFESPSMAELAAVHLRETPPDPASLNAQVPATLSAIILRALDDAQSLEPLQPLGQRGRVGADRAAQVVEPHGASEQGAEP